MVTTPSSLMAAASAVGINHSDTLMQNIDRFLRTAGLFDITSLFKLVNFKFVGIILSVIILGVFLFDVFLYYYNPPCVPIATTYGSYGKGLLKKVANAWDQRDVIGMESYFRDGRSEASLETMAALTHVLDALSTAIHWWDTEEKKPENSVNSWNQNEAKRQKQTNLSDPSKIQGQNVYYINSGEAKRQKSINFINARETEGQKTIKFGDVGETKGQKTINFVDAEENKGEKPITFEDSAEIRKQNVGDSVEKQKPIHFKEVDEGKINKSINFEKLEEGKRKKSSNLSEEETTIVSEPKQKEIVANKFKAREVLFVD